MGASVFRAIAVVFSGIVVVLLLVTGLTVRLAPRSKTGWKEFSIAPASGVSATINPGLLRADGITLHTALAVAYEIPAVRIIAPPWVSWTRYAIVAEAPEDRELFRQLFREEIKARFSVEAHYEKRPFEVFVLSAPSPHDLLPDGGAESSNRIYEWNAELRGATMDRLAGGLQAILGIPVVNETGIAGAYRFELSWGENRRALLPSALLHKYGLELKEAEREMEALVVDRIQPDGALSVITQVGRLAKGAPGGIRRAISSALTIH
jgi:uncharacterized protein (TIGR03435 family)